MGLPFFKIFFVEIIVDSQEVAKKEEVSWPQPAFPSGGILHNYCASPRPGHARLYNVSGDHKPYSDFTSSCLFHKTWRPSLLVLSVVRTGGQNVRCLTAAGDQMLLSLPVRTPVLPGSPCGDPHRRLLQHSWGHNRSLISPKITSPDVVCRGIQVLPQRKLPLKTACPSQPPGQWVLGVGITLIIKAFQRQVPALLPKMSPCLGLPCALLSPSGWRER